MTHYQGEYTENRFLEVVGDVFIRLLQMTVLPYVTVSLITGLGRLNAHQAIVLARKGGAVLVHYTVVVCLPLFPDCLELWTFKSKTNHD